MPASLHAHTSSVREMGYFPISQMRKLSLNEMVSLAQGFAACKQGNPPSVPRQSIASYRAAELGNELAFRTTCRQKCGRRGFAEPVYTAKFSNRGCLWLES